MKKTAIIYGELQNDIQKRALEELSAILLDYTFEYPVCLKYIEDMNTEDFRCVYIGTKENNPYIKHISNDVPASPESYSISVKDDTVVIEGYDDAGVLYGVLDFYNKYIVKFEHPEHVGNSNENFINLWKKDTLPDFECTSTPSVKERGLWTWGHVIYDYRKYIYNMMKLKMNGVIIWNDFVPTNAADIVAYAHSCNVKVYWGFSWLWDTDCNRFSIDALEGEAEKILQKYETEYGNAGGDGIYFQTFTELHTDNIGGVTIADAAAKFVNQTSALFYNKYPNIEIQFGLHATSVKNKLEFLRAVNPRIRIVWEDCGAFPFAYDAINTRGFDDTKEFVKQIACLRGSEERFGTVTKGFVKLDWSSFEHLAGSQYIGVSSERTKKSHAGKRARQWRYVQAGWLANSDKALEMVKLMSELKKGDLSVFALVEDGAFEENIMYPVALYSEMLWNCSSELKDIVRSVSLRSYVCFA